MATATRALRPEAPDWFHLVALIHDLGKMMALPQLAGKAWMGISDIWRYYVKLDTQDCALTKIQMLGKEIVHLLANRHPTSLTLK